MQEIEKLQRRIDELAGIQHAMSIALNMTLAPYKGNTQAIAALEDGFEQAKSMFLGSSMSDHSIRAFDEYCETLGTLLK